jgi:hypothetical protein
MNDLYSSPSFVEDGIVGTTECHLMKTTSIDATRRHITSLPTAVVLYHSSYNPATLPMHAQPANANCASRYHINQTTIMCKVNVGWDCLLPPRLLAKPLVILVVVHLRRVVTTRYPGSSSILILIYLACHHHHPYIEHHRHNLESKHRLPTLTWIAVISIATFQVK